MVKWMKRRVLDPRALESEPLDDTCWLARTYQQALLAAAKRQKNTFFFPWEQPIRDTMSRLGLVAPHRLRWLAASQDLSQFCFATYTSLPFNMLFRPFASSSLGRVEPSASRPSQVPEALPPDIPIDEENVPGYQPEVFYPANPGDVLNGRYELLAKVGWGTSSTVWLARNTSW